jgi:hypothetical protein
MMAAMSDWPSWINAATVVLLAGITTWYAWTNQKMLRHLQHERQDRFRGARQPFENALRHLEDRLHSAKQRIANEKPEELYDLREEFSRFEDRFNKLARDAVSRSFLLARRLQEVADAADKLGSSIAFTGPDGWTNEPDDELRDTIAALETAIATTRTEIERYIG